MNPIATKLMQAAGYAAAGVATKAVGSYYRVKDDVEAPKDVFHKTLRREGSLLAIAGGFLMGIQLLFTGLIYKRIPHISPFVESVTRLALAVPAFAVAEVVSREWGGSRSEIWEKANSAVQTFRPQRGDQNHFRANEREDHDDDDRDEARQLNRPHPQFGPLRQPAFSSLPVPPVAFMDGGVSFQPPSGYYPRSNTPYFHA